MTKSFEQQENNSGIFTFSFTKEEFADAMKWAYQKNAKRFNVPGFRKGKAPMQIALTYYGEGAIYDDAIDHIIAPAYSDAVKEFDVSPVSQPSLDIQNIGMEKGFDCTLTVDTEPVPELGEYKGVEAEKEAVEVQEEDIEKELTRIQERNSRMVPVEGRAAEDGDTANIDFEGFKDGVAFDGGKGENHDLVLGSGSFIPGFEEQVVGKNIGDAFDVNVTFPEEYGAEELAGQAAVFKVKLNSIKKKELPELNDDFAMDVSEFDTLEAYKDSIRKNLEEEAEKLQQQKFENNVLEKVIENTKLDIPHSMIHNEMDQLLRYQSSQMRAQGFELEQYLQFIGQSMEEYAHTLHEPAEKNLRVQLVLKAIADKEQLDLTEEEKAEEIKKLAEQTRLSEEEVKRQIGDSEMFFENARNQKALKFITDNAVAVAPTPKEKTKKTKRKAEETKEDVAVTEDTEE